MEKRFPNVRFEFPSVWLTGIFTAFGTDKLETAEYNRPIILAYKQFTLILHHKCIANNGFYVVTVDNKAAMYTNKITVDKMFAHLRHRGGHHHYGCGCEMNFAVAARRFKVRDCIYGDFLESEVLPNKKGVVFRENRNPVWSIV